MADTKLTIPDVSASFFLLNWIVLGNPMQLHKNNERWQSVFINKKKWFKEIITFLYSDV